MSAIIQGGQVFGDTLSHFKPPGVRLKVSPKSARKGHVVFSWAELKGGGKTYRKAKPREDGPSETAFRDPPKMVSEEVQLREILRISKGLPKRNGIGGGGGGQNVPR